MRGFDDLVRSGKVLYGAVSDTPAWVISRANMLAELRGWSPWVCLQTEYSLAERTSERDLLPMAHTCGLGVTAWSPLKAGVLTGKYNKGVSLSPEEAKRNPKVTPRLLEIADEVVAVAKESGHTPAQVAVKWLLQKPGNIIPILGARKPEQLEDVLGAVNFELDEEHMKRLDVVSAIELGFPHDFLFGETVQNFGLGGSVRKLAVTKRPQV